MFFSLFANLYKKIQKRIKKLLTSIDFDAIIVNCIIIAYYAHFADKQVFVSINLLYINGFAKRHRRAVISENAARKV